MDQETFSDPAVAAFLNERFVAIKVDGDREPSLAKAYKVTGYPDSRFLDREMKGVFQLPGFIESPAFFFFLEYIHSDSYKTMNPMQYYKTR
jgi:thioredoxin-related protein